MSDDAPIKPPEYCDCDQRCKECGRLKQPTYSSYSTYGATCSVCNQFVYWGQWHRCYPVSYSISSR